MLRNSDASGPHGTPVATFAKRVVVPWRLYVRHGAGSALLQRPGWVRSRAWIWLFSSKEDHGVVRRVHVDAYHVGVRISSVGDALFIQGTGVWARSRGRTKDHGFAASTCPRGWSVGRSPPVRDSVVERTRCSRYWEATILHMSRLQTCPRRVAVCPALRRGRPSSFPNPRAALPLGEEPETTELASSAGTGQLRLRAVVSRDPHGFDNVRTSRCSASCGHAERDRGEFLLMAGRTARDPRGHWFAVEPDRRVLSCR